MEKKRSEALEMIRSVILSNLNSAADDVAEEILTIIEDQEDGVGMYPPLTKKGLYEWADENKESECEDWY